MTQRDAQKRCDNLRKQSARTGLTYEVERERTGSRKFVVRSYRNSVWTGSTYHI